MGQSLSTALTRAWKAFLTPPPQAASRGVLLAVGAHPDDIEFGCGATLASYADMGYAAHGLVLTRGENGVGQGHGRFSREQEAMAGARRMGLASLNIHRFPDARLASRRDGVKSAIELAIQRLQPDVVLTHTGADLHFDHRLVHQATLEGARNVPTLLCYENPNTPPDFQPSLFVDVSSHIGRKVEALYQHVSQHSRPYLNAELVRGIARARGQQARVVYAEAFEVIRMRASTL
jgi:LmbE family N-acetylglucosaminyl deacetylase